ncbi:MAG: hypothetical protein J5879_05305 [Clostridia bacterium]|nr:hypothetical protein [Clostridia bacterium]
MRNKLKLISVAAFLTAVVLLTSCAVGPAAAVTSEKAPDTTEDPIAADTDRVRSKVNAGFLTGLKNAAFENTSAGSERDYSTLYQLSGTGISKQYGDLGHVRECAVLKITPLDYEFYITVIHLSETDTLFTGYTLLTASVSEAVMNYNGSDVKDGDVITIRQDMYITPCDEYMQDFTDTYGGGDESAIPGGNYKVDTEKLGENGVKRVVTCDVPLLDLNAQYYVFAITGIESGECSCCAYCDAELNPLNISDNYSYNGDDYKHFANELKQMIKEAEDGDGYNGQKEQSGSYDNVFQSTENIRSDDDASFSIINSLKELIEFKNVKSGEPVWSCAIVKFVPKEYKFVFAITTDSSGDRHCGGYAVLTADVSEIVSAYNGCGIQPSDGVEIKQYIEVTPGDGYMEYFISRYGDKNEGLKSVPDGVYEFEKDKLVEFGIKEICSKGSPILEYDKVYYAFVVTEESGALSDAAAYCDEDLKPVVITIKTVEYGWENRHYSSELIEMIKEIKA